MGKRDDEANMSAAAHRAGGLAEAWTLVMKMAQEAFAEGDSMAEILRDRVAAGIEQRWRVAHHDHITRFNALNPQMQLREDTKLVFRRSD